ncbi:magnesium transporter [Mycena amicta]|nr:magnesium transporter [Mycena amicta]
MSSSSSSMRPPVKPYSEIGSEPGVDPFAASSDFQYGQSPCLIEIWDYSPENVTRTPMTNEGLVHFLQQAPPEASSHLRWINVGGISWDVVSSLARRYQLHPLSLEDILHEQGHNHSKADYYQQHLFIRVLCHSLSDGDHSSGVEAKSEFPGYPRVTSSRRKGRLSGLSGFYLTARQQQILRIAALTKGDQIIVKHEPMFIFLLRNGTVISIHPKPNLDFTEPVTERMQQQDGVLRTSKDPSMIVEALLDLIVDRILEVMDKYQDKIFQLEHDVLVKPGMSTVRSLHILSGDLIMHRRTLEPIKSMIYGLRRYDQERCAAMGFRLANQRQSKDEDSGWGQEGFLSSKSKIYLADALDHMDFVMGSLETFAGISENLINYAFNMASYEMNQVMRRLTLATIIFLPLTLLTGYFGMNFTAMWSVKNNSDLLFWIIALPLMGVIVPLFLYQDIKKAVHYLQKVVTARRAVLAEDKASRQSAQKVPA